MSVKGMFYTSDHVETTDFQMADQRERLIYNVSEDLLVLMEDRNISKAQLAEMMGKSKASITQLLNGTRNMTLAKLSDLCFYLGVKPTVQIPDAEVGRVERAKRRGIIIKPVPSPY